LAGGATLLDHVSDARLALDPAADKRRRRFLSLAADAASVSRSARCVTSAPMRAGRNRWRSTRCWSSAPGSASRRSASSKAAPPPAPSPRPRARPNGWYCSAARATCASSLAGSRGR
jgi:hypothetical protein